jgi:hypothetical protein
MLDFAKISAALAYLREEMPSEDISKNAVFTHPHNTTRLIPERLPPAKIKELSRLQPARAVATTLGKWALIVASIALCTSFWHPALYVLAVLVIGSCQHALLILGHDASHYRRIINTQTFPTMGIATSGTLTTRPASSLPIGSFPKHAWALSGFCCAAPRSSPACFGFCAG